MDLTPVYGIKYLVQGEPARTTRQAMEDNAKTIEAALLRGAIAPPLPADYSTTLTRVTALETAQALDTNVPACRFRRVGTLGVNVAGGLMTASGTFYQVNWDTADLDATTAAGGAMYTAGKYWAKINRAGLYLLSAGFNTSTVGAGRRAIRTQRRRGHTYDGSGNPTGGTITSLQMGAFSAPAPAAIGDLGITMGGQPIRCLAGDIVYPEFYQDGGANYAVSSPDYQPTFMALAWVGP